MSVAVRLLMGGAGAFTAPVPFALTAAGEGGWPSNMSPALYHNGVTYFGYADSAGYMNARTYTHATEIVSSAVQIGGPTTPSDWHNDPALLIRASDSRILTVLCDHDAPTIYTRLSTNPEDITAWGASTNIDSQLGGSDYTYPVLFEQSGTIHLFYRDFQGGTTGVMCYSTSADDGATWTAQTELYKNAGKYAYWQVCSDGSRIDIATTDGSLEADHASVYHFYIEGGNRYKSNGTLISASLPLAPADLTKIYDGATNGARFVNGLARVGSGIAVTFPVFVTSDEGYRYARWNGAWGTNSVVNAGHTGDAFVEGGVVVDPADLNTLLLSRYIGGQWQIFEYATLNAGTSWVSKQLTSGTDASVYPSFIRNHAGGLTRLWLYGTATSYTSFSLAVYGIA